MTIKANFREENIVELIIKGKPEEIKNVLQAIGSSKEHSELLLNIGNPSEYPKWVKKELMGK